MDDTSSDIPRAGHQDREPRARLRADTLASSVVLLLGVSVVQRGIGFGRGILFCRWLSPTELGQWEMAFSFLLLAAPLAVLGIPGSFGRYLEQYRQRGQLRIFLRRTSFWTATLGAASVGVVLFAAPNFAKLIFGDANETTATLLVALSLATVILHHFLEALFTAMRMFRVVSVMHFAQSLLFALFGILLLMAWRMEATSIIIAYGAACAVSSCGAIIWSRSCVSDIPDEAARLPQRTFWPKLMRFAIWVWVSNMLFNLFTVADRYMIVHHSGLPAVEALGLVGHYHSSRIVPLLFVSVVDLLGGIVLPYLSKDWEAGRRGSVSARLNFVLKVTSIGLIAAGVVVLAIAPFLFRFAFQGKYDGGLAVLPMTLSYCSTFGIIILAQTYLWTAEKGRLCSVPIAAGLVINIALNLLLLPWLGLVGAVLATTIANSICLALCLLLGHWAGMRVGAGTILLAAAPLALCGGFEVAAATLCAILLISISTNRIFSTREKRKIRDALSVADWRPFRRPKAAAKLT